MTSKVAHIANLAFQAFQQYSMSVAITSSITTSQPSPKYRSPSNANTTNGQSAPDQSISPDGLLSDENLKRLISSIRSLTHTDIGFDPQWISDSNPAPVAYIHLTENEIFSMGIFILRPGSRIPLHDHPGMYGLIRVMYGSMRCRSYTPLRLSKSNRSNPRWQQHFGGVVAARRYQDVVLTPDSEIQILSPLEGNLHEITPVCGPAVFLDILAPPYDHDLGTRECKFYKEVLLPRPQSPASYPCDIAASGDGLAIEDCQADGSFRVGNPSAQPIPQLDCDTSSPVIYLVETTQPKDYWCDSTEYAGPQI